MRTLITAHRRWAALLVSGAAILPLTRRKNPRLVRQRATARLQIEVLEGRSVMSAYIFTDLGPLTPADINSSAQVVGTAGQHASLWNDGTLIDLGTLGGLTSAATAINDRGQVVGEASNGNAILAFLLTPEDTDGDGNADLWFRDLDANGANDLMTALAMPSLSPRSQATDINSAGQVVGYSWNQFGGQESALLWTNGRAIAELGTLGGASSAALGINDAGQVVGRAQNANGVDHEFLWDSIRGMTSLGMTTGYTHSVASAINNAGAVVGYQWDATGTYSSGAFAWTPELPNGTTGIMTSLPFGPGYENDVTNFASDINDAGKIVGTSTQKIWDANAPDPINQVLTVQRAVLWENDQATSAEALLGNESWERLDDAIAINAAGQVLVTRLHAEPAGYRQSFLLTPTALLAINNVTVLEGHSGTTNGVFTVTRSGVLDELVSVNFATASGTATAGGDYQSISGTLTFAPGETSMSIVVPIIGDRVGEPTESFAVNLSAPANATIGDSQGIVTILDDEPRISVTDVSKAEGKGRKTTLFTFTVTLSAACDQPVTVSYRTMDGSAKTSDNDYVAKTGTLTFAPGETTKTITIEVIGDNKKEADESFYLDLFGNSSNSSFTRNRGIGTIMNDG